MLFCVLDDLEAFLKNFLSTFWYSEQKETSERYCQLFRATYRKYPTQYREKSEGEDQYNMFYSKSNFIIHSKK